MANFKHYQFVSTVSKRFGGPVNFLLCVAIGGYFVIRTGESVVKKLLINKTQYKTQPIYSISKSFTEGDLILNIGDKIRILDNNEDCILIEKIGDKNSPYFILGDTLKEISNFEGDVLK